MKFASWPMLTPPYVWANLADIANVTCLAITVTLHIVNYLLVLMIVDLVKITLSLPRTSKCWLNVCHCASDNESDKNRARLNKGSELAASIAKAAGITCTPVYNTSTTSPHWSLLSAQLFVLVLLVPVHAISLISHHGTTFRPFSICSALHSHVEIWMV